MGALQEHHTSFLMNLNNRAYLFRFLDLQVPLLDDIQTPEAHISIFGDLVGGMRSTTAVQTSQDLSLPMV